MTENETSDIRLNGNVKHTKAIKICTRSYVFSQSHAYLFLFQNCSILKCGPQKSSTQFHMSE